MKDEPIVLLESGPRIMNRSAVKAHALKCSAERRAGKFTRVGTAFFDEVEADVEAMVRELRNKCPMSSERVAPDEGVVFVTGDLLEKVRAEFDAAIARIIQNKVMRQPSVGCTLQNTR